jgi:hypothetical protein
MMTRHVSWKAAVLVFAVIALIAIAVVNILGFRLFYRDSIAPDADVLSPGIRMWGSGDAHVIRARIPRLCFFPPKRLLVTVISYGKDGKEVSSLWPPEDGGSRVTVPLAHVSTSGFWHWYLPENWPDCQIVFPWHPKALPAGVTRDRSLYVNIEGEGYVELRVSRMEESESDSPSGSLERNGQL